MSGELRLGQFRYTTTPNDDLVIGSPTDAGLNTSKYIIFQVSSTTGYGSNPHLVCECVNPTSVPQDWRLKFSSDGTSISEFVYANLSNVFTQTVTFSNTVTSNVTLAPGTDDTQLATTHFVVNELSSAIVGKYAPLGPDSKVPTSYLPAAIFGALAYQGLWNGAPLPTVSSDNKGWYYLVSIPGTYTMNGVATPFGLNDWVVSDGDRWEKVDNNNIITSVNGKIGSVVLTTGDVAESGSNLYWTNDRTATSTLAGYVLPTSDPGTLTSSDTVVAAFQKVQYQINHISLTPGAQGIQGPIGLQGIQGIQGPIGLQGIQGIQGIQGVAANLNDLSTHICMDSGLLTPSSVGATITIPLPQFGDATTGDISKYKWTLSIYSIPDQGNGLKSVVVTSVGGTEYTAVCIRDDGSQSSPTMSYFIMGMK